jgi:DNA polymerase-3 subunit delta'
MKRPVSADDGLPEADRFLDAPHPRDIERLRGHEAAEAAFLEAYRSGRMHHAWIVSGPAGIGKASLAYRIAKFLAAHPDASAPDVALATDLAVPPETGTSRQILAGSFPDLATIRRSWVPERKVLSSEIRVDDVREGTRLFERTAITGGWRVVIIDSVDEMNANAANALLKMLEEPPRHALFLLVSHAPGRLLPTIRSRCRLLRLQPLPVETVAAITADLPPWADLPGERHVEAAGASDGSVREAIKYLDEDTAAFRRRIVHMLDMLPRLDGKAVRDLAAAVDGRAGAENMAILRLTVEDHLTNRLRMAAAGATPASLAPLAEVWDKLRLSARDAEIFNLDRRPLVIALFANLAEAVRAEQTSAS